MVLGIFKKSNKDIKQGKSTKEKTKNKPETKDEPKAKLDRTREEEISNRVESDLSEEKQRLSKKEYKKKRKNEVKERLLMHNLTLDRIAPRGNIKFGSVDSLIDGRYATILTFVVRPGSFNRLRPLWGIDTIPKLVSNSKLREKDIEAKSMHTIARRPDKWAENKVTEAVDVSKTGYDETTNSSQSIEAMGYQEYYNDTQIIASELKNGASYLDLSIRIILKAHTKEDLAFATQVLEREYASLFNATVKLVPFVGEQDMEYANMLDSARHQLGENYQLTSRELAGSYPFVTRGMNDPCGSYIGQLAQEVNNDPVLLDSSDFKNLAVVHARGRAEDLSSKFRPDVKHTFKATTAWADKFTQDAMIKGNKVVEFVLNQEDPRKVGRDLSDETAYINLTSQKSGINMFEANSTGVDEIAAYNILVSKIKAIVSQFSEQQIEGDQTVMNFEDVQNLDEILKEFYVDERMWKRDAKDNRDMIRLLNIPHEQVPKMSMFMIHLREKVEAAEKHGEAVANLASIKKVYNILKQMDSNYSDLFDRKTTIRRDFVRKASRVIFDFKSLKIRSHTALMGHFINVFTYGEQDLGEDDVIIIHGMDEMTESVNTFLRQRFGELMDRGVKVVLLYSQGDIMLGKEKEYQQHNTWFQNADLRITNSMVAKNIKRYEELLHVELPESVKQGLEGSDTFTYFLNRDRESILFNLDLT